MNCPACREPLIVLEHERVELDHCISCKGIWFDAGELELLLESASERSHVLDTFRTDSRGSERARKCPICLKRMEKVLAGNGRTVQIDRCRKGHGLWFDVGELDEILRIGDFGRNARVTNWLKEVFGKTVGSEREG